MKTIKILFITMSFLITVTAQAATFCVTTALELESALSTAGNNTQHDVIKIAEGTYVTSGSAFNFQESNGFDLDITGGWTAFFGNPCGQQLSGSPFNTILDGNSLTSVLDVELSFNADLLISGISFINGYTEMGRGGGISVSHVDSLETGIVTIERNLFINNEADFGSALYLRHAGRFIIRNNLMIANNAHTRYVATSLQQDGHGVYFTNNTVMFNTVTADDIAGVGLAGGGGTQLFIANNVIRDNDGRDLHSIGSIPLYLKNNNIDDMNVPNPTEILNHMDLPPRFEDVLLSFTPDNNSPLINAGVKPCNICPIPTPFDETWTLGNFDLVGNSRIQNGSVDIGALESTHNNDLIFWGVFD